MKRATAFALAALLPAALNAGPATASITMPLCSGGGERRTVTIPVSPVAPSRGDDDGCCVKGCHSGSSRKRGACHI